MSLYFFKLLKEDYGFLLQETGDKINLENVYSIYQNEVSHLNSFSKEELELNTFTKEPLQINTFTKEPLVNI